MRMSEFFCIFSLSDDAQCRVTNMEWHRQLQYVDLSSDVLMCLMNQNDGPFRDAVSSK